MPDCTVGVDISKTHLDACMAPAGKAARQAQEKEKMPDCTVGVDISKTIHQ